MGNLSPRDRHTRPFSRRDTGDEGDTEKPQECDETKDHDHCRCHHFHVISSNRRLQCNFHTESAMMAAEYGFSRPPGGIPARVAGNVQACVMLEAKRAMAPRIRTYDAKDSVVDRSMRRGFAVKVLGEPCLKSNDMRRWQNGPHLRTSLGYLRAIFAHLARRRITMYRISSDLTPYATHPDLPQFNDQLTECAGALRDLGMNARALYHSLTAP
jgi:hypothetical protein